jgi:hypothetical protein
MPLTFFFTANGDVFGTTTTGIPFSQITVLESPRVQEFRIEDEHWFVCAGGAMETLSDLSICLANS